MELRVADKNIGVVLNALDFYSRIWIGQYGEIEHLLRLYDFDRADPVLTISGQESNYRLLLESLEVYSCLFRCKIKSLFEHYTDNPEALCIAKRLEEMYVGKIKETSQQLQDTLMQIEKLGQRIRALILKMG